MVPCDSTLLTKNDNDNSSNSGTYRFPRLKELALLQYRNASVRATYLVSYTLKSVHRCGDPVFFREQRWLVRYVRPLCVFQHQAALCFLSFVAIRRSPRIFPPLLPPPPCPPPLVISALNFLMSKHFSTYSTWYVFVFGKAVAVSSSTRGDIDERLCLLSKPVCTGCLSAGAGRRSGHAEAHACRDRRAHWAGSGTDMFCLCFSVLRVFRLSSVLCLCAFALAVLLRTGAFMLVRCSDLCVP